MANADSAAIRRTTGTVDWSGGVDSGINPLVASNVNPNGLPPNKLPWLNNATVRDSCISPRPGWQYLCTLPIVAAFQEAYMYEPDLDFPYIMAQVGGRTFQVRVDTDNSIAEQTVPADPNPALTAQNWMVQGEQFLIIQDGTSEPLVWDGAALRRISAMGGPPKYLPAGQPMDYYMGRIWIANGREYIASDIVGNDGAHSSGTAAYHYRDSILHMTENTFINGGGQFIVPTLAGNIRAMKHCANLNTALGEGLLFPFTRKTVYSVNVPVTRADWASLSEPLQRVAQITFGAVSDRAIVPINGDLYYQSVDGVRSFSQAVRNFEQPGQLPISQEEQRAVERNDRALLRYATGIEFNNRLLQSCLPFQTPVGVAHAGIMPLNFDLQGNIQTKLPPAWEGVWEGLNVLRLLSGDFGGRQRAFAIVWSEIHQAIEVWEITNYLDEDQGKDGPNRVSWQMETPSYDWGKPFVLKELDTAELWIDRLFGKVEFTVDYRAGESPCWQHWAHWEECAARNSCEDINPPTPCDYPDFSYKPQFRSMIVLPKAPAKCDPTNGRPSNLGYSFQVRIRIKGKCRLRGLIVHCFERERSPYEGMRCVDNAFAGFTPQGNIAPLGSGYIIIQGPMGQQGEQGPAGDPGTCPPCQPLPLFFGTVPDPNGIIGPAPIKSFYKDTVTGQLWIKTTDGGTFGWV